MTARGFLILVLIVLGSTLSPSRAHGDPRPRLVVLTDISMSVSARKGTTLGARGAPAERLRGESLAGGGEGFGRRANFQSQLGSVTIVRSE
jgi:hypothetical protein